MSIINEQAVANSRKVRSGKDGALYNGTGKLIATAESFQAQMSLNNTKFQPLGSPQEFEVNTSFGTTLNFTEFVVEDNEFIEDLIAYQDTGVVPEWNFQGVLKGRNGSEERMVYPYCIPSGNIDLQNISTGDVIKRSWSLYVNGTIAMQGKLTAN